MNIIFTIFFLIVINIYGSENENSQPQIEYLCSSKVLRKKQKQSDVVNSSKSEKGNVRKKIIEVSKGASFNFNEIDSLITSLSQLTQKEPIRLAVLDTITGPAMVSYIKEKIGTSNESEKQKQIALLYDIEAELIDQQKGSYLYPSYKGMDLTRRQWTTLSYVLKKDIYKELVVESVANMHLRTLSNLMDLDMYESTEYSKVFNRDYLNHLLGFQINCLKGYGISQQNFNGAVFRILRVDPSTSLKGINACCAVIYALIKMKPDLWKEECHYLKKYTTIEDFCRGKIIGFKNSQKAIFVAHYRDWYMGGLTFFFSTFYPDNADIALMKKDPNYARINSEAVKRYRSTFIYDLIKNNDTKVPEDGNLFQDIFYMSHQYSYTRGLIYERYIV